MDSLDRTRVIEGAFGGDGYGGAAILRRDGAFVGHPSERRQVRRRKGDQDLVWRHGPGYFRRASQLKGGSTVAHQVERPALDLSQVVVASVGTYDPPVPLDEIATSELPPRERVAPFSSSSAVPPEPPMVMLRAVPAPLRTTGA